MTQQPRSGPRGACAPAPAARAGRPARASACPPPTARSAADPCASSGCATTLPCAQVGGTLGWGSGRPGQRGAEAADCQGSGGPGQRGRWPQWAAAPSVPLQCMVPGMSGRPGASAPAPVAVAFGIARAPAGPPSLGATPVRALRSKPSSATLPCALVGEREGVGAGRKGRKGRSQWATGQAQEPSFAHSRPTSGCSEVGTSDWV